MNRRNMVFNILFTLILGLIFWFFNRGCELLRLTAVQGGDLVQTLNRLPALLLRQPFRLSPDSADLAIAAAVTVAVVFTFLRQRKRFRPGEEYGSARFGDARDIRPFINPQPDGNILLTQTERLTMESRPKRPELARNKNVVVIGGSGSGKTRFYVKPNLLQMHSSYVVTDPKGTLLEECGRALAAAGYRVRALNLNGAHGMAQSMHYNPFHYIRCEADILRFVTVLMDNTDGEGGQNKGERFWRDAEQLYYCALIGYLWTAGDPRDRNMGGLLQLHNAAKSPSEEGDDGVPSTVDILFDELEQQQPNCFAVRQYKKFKHAVGKTASGILITAGSRLAPFDIKEVRELMCCDELELERLGEEKTALFVITSDTDKTFNFIAAILYAQMFNLLCDRALEVHGGRLPVHVRFLLDEFANIGKIPNFENIISIIRSREISANVILQSRAQLEAVYEKKADIILDNCDTMLFLGGQGKVLEEVSKLLGKQTIQLYNDSKSRGTSRTDSTNFQTLGRELLTVDELARLPRGECICQISGVRPFRSKKYDLTRHPRYKLLADADPKNLYSPPWLRQTPLISDDELFEVFIIEN